MPFPRLSIGHFSFWSCATVSSSANADPAWAPAMSIELKNLFSSELAYPQKSSNAPNCNHEAALHPRRRPRRHVHDSVGRLGARHRHIRGSEHRPRHRRHQREPHHDRLRRQEQRRQVTGSPRGRGGDPEAGTPIVDPLPHPRTLSTTGACAANWGCAAD